MTETAPPPAVPPELRRTMSSPCAAQIDKLIDRWRDSLEECDDRETLVWAIKDIRQLVKDLQLLDLRAEERVVDLSEQTGRGGWRPFDVPGIGRVSLPRSSKTTRWHHDDVYSRMLRLARERPVDLATGEMVPPEEALLCLIRRCASVSAWRVGELAQVDPEFDREDNEYVTTEKGRPKVRLP